MAIKIGKVFNWIVKRAKEPSTYVGLGVIATAVGKPEIANAIGQYGQAAVLILGGGLIAHPNTLPVE